MERLRMVVKISLPTVFKDYKPNYENQLILYKLNPFVFWTV